MHCPCWCHANAAAAPSITPGRCTSSATQTIACRSQGQGQGKATPDTADVEVHRTCTGNGATLGCYHVTASPSGAVPHSYNSRVGRTSARGATASANREGLRRGATTATNRSACTGPSTRSGTGSYSRPCSCSRPCACPCPRSCSRPSSCCCLCARRSNWGRNAGH